MTSGHTPFYRFPVPTHTVRPWSSWYTQVQLPDALQNIERVSSIEALGITISSQLSMNEHVNTLLDSCARTLWPYMDYEFSERTAWVMTVFTKSSGLQSWPSWCMQAQPGQASVLQATSVRLTDISTDVTFQLLQSDHHVYHWTFW